MSTRSITEFASLRTVIEIVQLRAQYQPDKVAYRFLKNGDQASFTLSYRQLDLKARALAACLIEQGLTGERALLLLPSGPEFIEAFFGCLYAGVTAVPAYPPRNRRSLPRLKAIVEDAEAMAVLATTQSISNIQSLIEDATGNRRLTYLAVNDVSAELAEDWEEPLVESHTLAFLQYTSGSTGTPKGVMVTHRNILSNLEMIRSAFQINQDDIGFGWLPLFHDMGLIGHVLEPVYAGIPSVLMSPAAFLQKPMSWLRAISEHRATISGGPNFAYELCLRHTSDEERSLLDLSRWRVTFNGAEPIRAATLDGFSQAFAPCGFRREAFLSCYGMAEATLIVSGGPADAAPVIVPVDGEDFETRHQITHALPNGHNARTLVGCGTRAPDALSGQRVIIVDPDSCTKCRPGEIGEIWVDGPHVAMGYWNRPEETRSTFRAYTADTGEGRFLRTGDLGFLHENELVVTGRLKDLIILHGRNIYPQDIEWTVQRCHPALAHGGAAAFSVEVHNEEKLVVVQELAHRQKPDLSEVLGRVRQVVADVHEAAVYAIALIKPRSLPKTSSGKVQRGATRQQFLAGELKIVAEWCVPGKATETSNTALEQQTAKVKCASREQGMSTKAFLKDWLIAELAANLQISPTEIDIYQPFTYYGLASVEGVALAAKLEDHLGRPMPLSLVWDHPTIDAVSSYLSQGSRMELIKDCGVAVPTSNAKIVMSQLPQLARNSSYDRRHPGRDCRVADAMEGMPTSVAECSD